MSLQDIKNSITVVRNETVNGANTKTRVADILDAIVTEIETLTDVAVTSTDYDIIDKTTQAEYDALTPDERTLYIVPKATTPVTNISWLVKLEPADIDPAVTTDNTAISSWNDSSGNNLNATITNSVLNIGSTGRQAQNGTAGYVALPLSASLDYNVGVGGGSFTIVWREGDVVPTTGTFVSKAVATGADREWSFFYNNANTISMNLGGSEAWSSTAITPNTNRLFIAIIDGANFNLWVDGVNVIVNSAIGTSSVATTQQVNIFSRTNGGFPASTGSQCDFFGMIDGAINATERGEIETAYQIN